MSCLTLCVSQDKPLLTVITNSRQRSRVASVSETRDALLRDALRRCAAWRPSKGFGGTASSALGKRKEIPLGLAAPPPPRKPRGAAATATPTPRVQPPQNLARKRVQAGLGDSSAPDSTAPDSSAPDSAAPTIVNSLRNLPKQAQVLLRTGGVKALAIDALQDPRKLQAHRYAAPHNPASAMVVVIADIAAQVNGGAIPRFEAAAAAAAAPAAASTSAACAMPEALPGMAPALTDVDGPVYQKLERLGAFLVGNAASAADKHAMRVKVCRVSATLAAKSSRDEAAGAIGLAYAAGEHNRPAQEVAETLFLCLQQKQNVDARIIAEA